MQNVHKQYLLKIFGIALFFLMTISVSFAATLSLGQKQEKIVGNVFSVPVYISTKDSEAMNALDITVNFPKDLVQVVSISKRSVIDMWITSPSYSNSDGGIIMQGITYNPGFSGQNGKVVDVTFKAIAPGEATISFGKSSVLANDGQGSEILASATGQTISISKSTQTQVEPSVEKNTQSVKPNSLGVKDTGLTLANASSTVSATSTIRSTARQTLDVLLQNATLMTTITRGIMLVAWILWILVVASLFI